MLKTDLLKAALFTPMPEGRWGLPLLFVGEPGIAKTAVIKGMGKAMGVHVQSLTPGRDGEAAFGVVPFPAERKGRTVLTYPEPEWAQQFNGNAGILFLDEINTADRALAPALHSLIQDCQCGSWTGNPRVRVIAAMNPTDHATSGDDLSAANSNRLVWINASPPSPEEFASYLLSGSGANLREIDTEAEERRVLKAWPQAYAKSAALVSAFCRVRLELLHKMPKNGDPQQSGPWPSARTWDMVSRVLASAEIHNLSDESADELVAGCVGVDASCEFSVWETHQDLPDPVKLLDGQELFTPDKARLDRTEAVLSGIAATVVTDPKTEWVQTAWEIIRDVSEGAKDSAIPAITTLARAKLHKSKTARDLLSDIHGIVVGET